MKINDFDLYENWTYKWKSFSLALYVDSYVDTEAKDN